MKPQNAPEDFRYGRLFRHDGYTGEYRLIYMAVGTHEAPIALGSSKMELKAIALCVDSKGSDIATGEVSDQIVIEATCWDWLDG